MKKLTIFIVLIIFLASGLPAQQKYALVIGNANYVNAAKLKNPVNDANDMAAVLKGLGFSVDIVLNGTQEQMVNAVMRLKQKLSVSKNSYGFLFYAGHGVQSNGENYLIPVNADIPGENFLRNRTVSLQEMLDEINDAGNEFNVIVVDACRDNPFSWKRSGSRGLSVLFQQPADSIIIFSTVAGSIANDGEGRNGLFTSHLLNNLKQSDLEVMEVFRRTGADVSRASGNQQRPAVYSQFYGTAYLGKKKQAAATPKPLPAPAAVPAPAPAPAVRTLPVSTMVRIQAGTFIMGSPTIEPERGSNEIQHQIMINSFYIGNYEVTQKEYQEIMGKNPSNFKGDNLPVENVNWFDAIEYCNKRSQKEGLTPAYTINKNQIDPNNKTDDKIKWTITWNKNANGYRLPTEAEWEYACRAGMTMPFSTGSNITTSQANYNGDNPYNNNTMGEYRQKTTEVGSFPPNAWGLYDMHGNVFEWCWDWYGNYSNEVQNDPVGAVAGTRRVRRGGYWGSDGDELRSAYRGYASPYYWDYTNGFRVARSSN